MKVKKVFIDGMHCSGCVNLMEKELSKIKGVKKVEVSLSGGFAKIYYDNLEPDFEEIQKIVTNNGYKAYDSLDDKKRNQKLKYREWLITLSIFSIILLIFIFLKKTNIINNISFLNKEISYTFSFMMGVVASISTCFAVVGSVVLTFNQRHNFSNKNKTSDILLPNILFQIGRVGGFFILGGLLGMIGGTLKLENKFFSIYTILIGVILIFLSLNMIGITLPFKVNIFKNFTLIEKTKKSKGIFSPLLLGIFTFFLPCGFTQSMQALALLSGSFLKGGFLLFLFSLGTLPVLLLLGIFSRTIKVGNFKILQKTLGLIIILMAFYTISSGITIYKNTLISNSLNKENIVENIESFKDFQIVEMHIKYSGFEPNVIKVKKGIPVKWIIYGDEVTGCTDRIIVPSLNIKKDITSYETIIIFTPKEKGVIPFSCWMGMVRGKFIVE